MQKYQELENELMQALSKYKPKKEGDYILFDLTDDPNDPEMLKVLNILQPTNPKNRKVKLDLQKCSMSNVEQSCIDIFSQYCLFNEIPLNELEDKLNDNQIEKGFLLLCRKICLAFAGSFLKSLPSTR